MADYSLSGLSRAFGGQALDAAHGASRGISADLLGGPVDLISLLLRTAGMPIPSDPVGGSEWIGGKLESAGLLRPQTGSPPESVGRLAGGLLATPQTVGKVGMAAEQGVKSLGMAAGQKIDDAMMGRGGLLGTALKPSQPYPLTVYHGSPHKFDRFESSKIGTGEGAQAYGHGLYLAENPKVAGSYQHSGLSGTVGQIPWKISGVPSNTNALSSAERDALASIQQFGFDKSRWMKAAQNPNVHESEHAKRVIDAFDSLQKRGVTAERVGNLYKVDLPDEQIAKMLDWDKPLSQQPENVRKALKRYMDLTPEILSAKGGDFIAGRFKGAFVDANGNVLKAEEALGKAGIPGIKYLDAGSRTAGQGSRNFVVFDDQIPKILERNNQPIGGLLGTR